MLLHEFHGLLELVGRVECEQFNALEVALGDTGQRARPVAFPSRPVTPKSAMAAMHRSQRTGAATWPTNRLRTSRPSWTTCPSAFDSKRVRGS